MFIHLHWHSHYSLLKAYWTIDKILEKVQKLGMNSVAITDYNNMHWIIEFYEKATKLWINPIIGVELWIVSDYNSTWEDIKNITLLAKNLDWYKSLLKLVSFANIKWYEDKPKIDFKVLETYKDWLIGFMWWTKSQLWNMVLLWEEDDKLLEKIKIYQNILWKENFFLEIIAQDHKLSPNLKIINNKIIELATKTWTELIVNNNFHYIEKSDKDAYEILKYIKKWWRVDSNYTPELKQDYSILNEEEVINILKGNWFHDVFISGLIENNLKIANQIKLEISLWTTLFPNYKSDKKIEEIYLKNKNNLIE